MKHTDLRGFYRKRKLLFEKSLATSRKRINVISNFRLAIALLFLVLLYFAFSSHFLFYLLPPLLVAFILFVRWHDRLFVRKVRLENLKQIQQDELYVLDGDFSHNGSGSEFINVHHPYTHDLDIFGEGSIFQYLNRCNTRGGKKLLADRLSFSTLTVEQIARCQEAVREVANKVDFRHEIQALSMQIDEQPQDRQQLEQWFAEAPFIYGRSSYRLILHIFPLVTIALVIAAFFVDGVTTFAVLAACLQWGFLGFHLRRVNSFHQYISRKKALLEKYGQLLNCIRSEGYSSALMQSLNSRAEQADEKVKQLASLVGAFDARMNSMTNLVVNSLFLYDLQCVYRLEKWKEENAKNVAAWLDIICETEVLCSLGAFSFNHENFSFPRISAEKSLAAIGMGHPLLRDDERVVNDLDLDDTHSIMIITGANMAGKSTFLRSLGVNVVLALCGAPVCAREFVCPLIEVRSGMRTADSLKEHQSYFYAELDRLKSIMDELREHKTLLILLDEILKGTNSTDKQAGSVALVKQLVDHSCLVLIATHDLALGDLEDDYPVRIQNYSFEATIENEQLSFDYKLKRGPAQNMNATFLMRKMGIINY